LEILQLLPGGDVRGFTQAAVMFNQPMAEPGGVERASLTLLEVDPPMAGRVAWINQFALASVSEKILPGSASAKATLSPDARSLSGAGLPPGIHAAEFRLPALAAKSYRLGGGEAGEALRPLVEATFSQPVDPGYVNGLSFFAWGSGGPRERVPARWAAGPGSPRGESRRSGPRRRGSCPAPSGGPW
jgi:hypothetical protein